VGDFVPAATTDLHVQFLRPGTGAAILCRAHVARLGRSLAFARAEMMAEETEKTVALASATLALP
jgi:acyl-coenzyme A thioesterase PaaI-like protein